MSVLKQTMIVSCLFFGGVEPLAAALLVIDSTDRGWYRDTGEHTATNPNTIVGYSKNSVATFTYRNWFVFDLSGVSGTILSAELHLENSGGSLPGYISPDPTETYTLYDVSTDITTLRTEDGGGMGLSVYSDLGSGSVFGSKVVSAADNGEIVQIDLNSDALGSLNSADSLWAIGGALTTIEPEKTTQTMFASTGHLGFVRQLVITTADTQSVPEPTGLTLCGLCAVLCGALNRSRKTR